MRGARPASNGMKRSANPGSRFVLRVRLIALGFFVATVVIIMRLYFLQIMHGADYALKADRQFTAPGSALFARGSIYFTGKDGTELAAATVKDGVSVGVLPQKIRDPEATWEGVKDIAHISHDEYRSRIQKPGAQYVEVAEHLSAAAGADLQKKNIPGVEVDQDRWRFYPGGSLAAQEIGFVAYNGDALEGRYGLESYYDSTLERQGSDLYANFFVELFTGLGSALSGNSRGDIITTIEPSVQAELERQLAAYQAKWHPGSAGAIIMNPKTGAIYAMAVTPSFDLNNFGAEQDPRIFGNPLVQNVYEMGSIIKPLTMAAGLDSGVITPESTYDDTGCITVNTAKICNFDGKARGVIPMQQILSQSLNVGASFVATSLGPARVREYFLDRYKLGEETGIDLPAEASGFMKNLQSPRDLEYDTAAFGQGIGMTPIETVRALAVLSNGGYLVTPHLASAVRDESGLTRTLGWSPGAKVLSDQTTGEVSQMLTTVVDTALVNGQIKLDHWSVAAKTGTAQIANPAGGGYYTDRYLHSFFGYFPSYDARFIIFLYSFEPVGAQYASQTWAGPFHDLTKFLINYYNVPPDR